MQSQHHWRLSTLIWCLLAIALGHICIDVSRTASINQNPSVLLRLFHGQDFGVCGLTCLADRVCLIRRKPRSFQLPFINGVLKLLHQSRDGGDRVLGRGEEGIADFVGVFVQSATHTGDIDETTAVADDGEERVRSFQGAVIVGCQSVLDNGGVEAIECYAGIVDGEIDALWMLFLQEILKSMNTLGIAYVQCVIFDRSVSSILGQDFGFFKLSIVVQGLDCFSTTLRGSSGEIYQEGSRFEWRGRVLEGELANCSDRQLAC